MRRISNTNSDSASNLLFTKHETDFWEAFIDNNELSAEDLHEYYVSSRRAAVSKSQVDELLSRLPDEFSELYAATIQARNDPEIFLDYRVGYYELDLIDFLFNISANRVLCVIGTVGIGKTTFLTYIFQSLRKQISALQKYIPITVSFMQFPSAELSDDDLFSSVIIQATNCLESEMAWREESDPEWLTINNHLQKLREFSSAEHKSRLIELINFVKKDLVFKDSEFEYVVIFDNIDHLNNESISKVSVFARALFLESRLAIILGVRPPSYSSHVATDAHRGAFNSFRIHLPPPDLGAYFSRRIRMVFSKELITIPTSNNDTPITIPVDSAVRNIVKNVLSRPNSKLILEGISNNSIRKASRAFLNIARYEHLSPHVLFNTLDDDKSRDLNASRLTDTLIDGLMHGEFKFFRDNDVQPVVSNIYVFDHPEYAPDYLIQHRVLSLLNWAVKSIDLDVLMVWLTSYGYEQRQISLCLNQMLVRGLLFSPESDHDMSLVRYVSYSPSGQYYLEELMSSKQYLWNAIFDVPLEHSGFTEGKESEFEAKLKSICEFIEKLGLFENKQIEFVKESKYISRLLGSLVRNGLLQRKVMAAARKILVGAKHSKKKNIKNLAEKFDTDLDTLECAIDDSEKMMSLVLLEDHLIDSRPRVGSHVCTKRWGRDHSVTLWIPNRLEPAAQNIISIECDIGKDSKTTSLVGRLQGLDESHYVDEITELRRAPGKQNKFSGVFRVEKAKIGTALTSVKLSLFAESRPILRSILDVSGRSYD